MKLCIPHDSYKFTIRDTARNGMAGEHGDGYFQIFVDDKLVASGGNFGDKRLYRFNTWVTMREIHCSL